MTFKPSPGPWAVHGGPGEPIHYVHGANRVAVIPEPSGYYQSPLERESNARLIAAAPDLLTALERATQALGAMEGPTFDEVHRNSVAAIIKAKGTT